MTARLLPRFAHLFLILLLGALACSFAVPSAVPSQSPASVAPVASTAAPAPALATGTAAIAPVVHQVTPPGATSFGTILNDVDSSGTAPENRAPYGDSYNINLFERPFTQTEMKYNPALDIFAFSLNQDNTWYYVSVQMKGGDMNDPVGIDYGVELDTNHDGVGDYLVWAQPPYSATWTTDTVAVYSDPNHDVGGASPEKSDANVATGAPYPGDGYETTVFNKGQGTDPDLAWVRLDPQQPSTVEFAFKRSLAGSSFMWGVWADAGLKDPSKFNYNDRFTQAQAGSPIKNTPDYPIKAIYQVDNTCWAPFGFNPTGYEPHLCPSSAPPVAKNTKVPPLQGVPLLVCPNPYPSCNSAPPGCPCTQIMLPKQTPKP